MPRPPGTKIRDGQLVRILTKRSADGTEREQVRPVALTQAEARKKRWDWFHPELGWVKEGYKLVTDRSVGSRMMDGSSSVAVHEEDRPTESEEISG